MSQLQLIHTPPSFCQYVDGPCDQEFRDVPSPDGFALYPSDPEIIASTIEEAIKSINVGSYTVRSWKDLRISGQIIFCEVCKAMRFARAAITDVTTLNFNLLFG